jgi:putative transcriptional regulator
MGGAMKNRLAELRSNRGWTQQELAERSGVSRQTIISLESGRYNPSILLAIRLARLFGESVETVFLYEEQIEHE